MKQNGIWLFSEGLFIQHKGKDNSIQKHLTLRLRRLISSLFTMNVTRNSQFRDFIKTMFIMIILLVLSDKQIMGNNLNDSTFIKNDTLLAKEIIFSPESASDYVKHLIGMRQLWKHSDEGLKHSLNRLINNFETPIDSIRKQLNDFDFAKVDYDTTIILTSDTLPLRWLEESLFIIDTLPLEKSPYIIQKTIILKSLEPDSASLQLIDSIPMLIRIIDSLFNTKDTLTERLIDFPYLKSKKIQVHHVENGIIIPPFFPDGSLKKTHFSKDSTQLIISKYEQVLMAGSKTPFFILPGGNMPDSLQNAVETLLSYTWERDSVQLFISGMDGRKTPFWLSQSKSDLYRYWLRNSKNDSITVWLGNPSKYHLLMTLEESVNVERMGIVRADNTPFITALPNKTLAPVKLLKEIPIFWDFGFIGSISLNQNYITYWAQGGESSFAGMLDLSGNAIYSNKEKKSKWINSGRMRYGNVWTKEKGARVNTDIIEINSQYNKIIADKLDFSSVFYFKTQISKGYNYPNDSVAVSKFLNPGTFTIGIGAEFSPFDKTLINFSPLSYKNTFVLDTNNIDQTIHGVAKGQKSKQEIGGQLLIKNNFTLLDDINVANTIRLFSSYADNPQNIDVDWETTLEKRISWIFSIKLNIHLIYDDDIRFPKITPEGNEIKVPRTQFNQFLGLSVSLNL